MLVSSATPSTPRQPGAATPESGVEQGTVAIVAPPGLGTGPHQRAAAVPSGRLGFPAQVALAGPAGPFGIARPLTLQFSLPLASAAAGGAVPSRPIGAERGPDGRSGSTSRPEQVLGVAPGPPTNGSPTAGMAPPEARPVAAGPVLTPAPAPAPVPAPKRPATGSAPTPSPRDPVTATDPLRPRAPAQTPSPAAQPVTYLHRQRVTSPSVVALTEAAPIPVVPVKDRQDKAAPVKGPHDQAAPVDRRPHDKAGPVSGPHGPVSGPHGPVSGPHDEAGPVKATHRKGTHNKAEQRRREPAPDRTQDAGQPSGDIRARQQR